MWPTTGPAFFPQELVYFLVAANVSAMSPELSGTVGSAPPAGRTHRGRRG